MILLTVQVLKSLYFLYFNVKIFLIFETEYCNIRHDNFIKSNLFELNAKNSDFVECGFTIKLKFNQKYSLILYAFFNSCLMNVKSTSKCH